MAENMNLPEPSLQSMVSMFASQAMVALGILNIPGQEPQKPDLNLAQHFIGLLEVIQEKTAGNTTPEEGQVIEQTLHQARMGFLAVKDSIKD